MAERDIELRPSGRHGVGGLERERTLAGEPASVFDCPDAGS